MKRMLKTGALLVLVVTTATACPRRVEVESEPNEPEYQRSAPQSTETDAVGLHDSTDGTDRA